MIPNALIISDNNILSKFLYTELSKKGIASEMHDLDFQVDFHDFDYIFVSILDKLDNFEIEKIKRILDNSGSKITFVLGISAADYLAQEVHNFIESAAKSNANIRLVYLGDIYDLVHEPKYIGGMGTQILRESLEFRSINLPNNSDAYFYLLTLREAIEEVIRAAFTYASSNSILIGHRHTLDEFTDIARRIYPTFPVYNVNREISEAKGALHITPIKKDDIPQSLFNKEKLEKIELPELKKYKAPSTDVDPVKKKKKIYIPIKISNKKAYLAAIVVLWFFSLPFITLLTSAVFAYTGYKSVTGDKNIDAKKMFIASKSLSYVSNKSFSLLENIPLFGSIFEPTVNASSVINKGSDIGVRIIDLESDLNKKVSFIFSNVDYDSEKEFSDLHLKMESLYEDISFLESDLDYFDISAINNIISREKLSEYRSYLYSGSVVARNLPGILGDETEKTYLVLLQNNNELRPTGGFIGSFLLVNFSHGKLINTEVYDVYSADGQLKGYVEPPEPIVQHLGEASWYLRDSNWDPDFPVSAEYAEWFLDKTLNAKVDGVIALNLSVLENILRFTGPIVLTDFGETITSDNVFDKIHSKIEDNFFPGSHSKANYLTALSNKLINTIKESEDRKQIGAALYDSLEKREIQIYMNDKNVQQITSVLGWSGELKPEGVWLSVNEANLGVNKANQYIERGSNLSVKIDNEYISYTLRLIFKNNASRALNPPDTRYKAYVRVIAPFNSEFSTVASVSSEGTKNKELDLERNENMIKGGVLVDVNASEQEELIYTWKTPFKQDFSRHGNLPLTWQKQSGVSQQNTDIEVQLPEGGLTKSKILRYNTDLSQDFKEIIVW